MASQRSIELPASISIVAGTTRVSPTFEISYEASEKSGGVIQLFARAAKSPGFAFLRSPSGTGKSTLLRLFHAFLQGIDQPQESTLGFHIQPNAVASKPRTVGYVPQDPPFLAHWVAGRLLPEDSRLLEILFPDETAKSLRKRHLGKLSGGQRKRVYTLSALERLLHTPGEVAFLLLDETLDGLGEAQAGECLTGLANTWHQNTEKPLYVTVVTHLGDTRFLKDHDVARRVGLHVVEDKSDQLRVLLEMRDATD